MTTKLPVDSYRSYLLARAALYEEWEEQAALDKDQGARAVWRKYAAEMRKEADRVDRLHQEAIGRDMRAPTAGQLAMADAYGSSSGEE